MEMSRIDAACPAAQVPEATCGELAPNALGCHHDAGCGAVKSAQQPIAPACGKTEASGDVFREARAIAGGEGNGASAAIPTCRQPERSFSEDVYRVRGEGV